MNSAKYDIFKHHVCFLLPCAEEKPPKAVPAPEEKPPKAEHEAQENPPRVEVEEPHAETEEDQQKPVSGTICKSIYPLVFFLIINRHKEKESTRVCSVSFAISLNLVVFTATFLETESGRAEQRRAGFRFFGV